MDKPPYQHLIIGSGVAGLSLALRLAAAGGRVLLASKSALRQSNSWYAQGGIASVLDAADSFANHTADTMNAGAGLCHPEVVETIVSQGPEAIHWLRALGATFTLDGPALHLSQEGGHSHRRVVHAADLTGQEVMRTLIAAVAAEPKITVMENVLAIDLVTTDKVAPSFSENRCLGAYFLHLDSGAIEAVGSLRTYLCTGGQGKIYLYTSNPDSATGDGVAMGWRAGCRVANLEFMQFHPTCLFHPQVKTYLITEALRGEGATLRDSHGHAFMADHHPMADLAPRDVVARAIDTELKRSGAKCVFLDVSHLDEQRLRQQFPGVMSTCERHGIFPTQQPIPVVPAAHYSCGGLITDCVGRTDVVDLFAVGEVACTGLHGANRLASNSLLEALVIAARAAQTSLATPLRHDRPGLPAWEWGDAQQHREEVLLAHSWDEIRRIMWNYVGIVRSEARLARALSRIAALVQELDRSYWEHAMSRSLVEVRNLAHVAWLTVRCAIARKESRGIHYTIDHPQPDDARWRRDTVVR